MLFPRPPFPYYALDMHDAACKHEPNRAAAHRDTIKDSSPRYIRLGIELDHVTALAFSDNSKRLVCATAKSRVSYTRVCLSACLSACLSVVSVCPYACVTSCLSSFLLSLSLSWGSFSCFVSVLRAPFVCACCLQVFASLLS